MLRHRDGTSSAALGIVKQPSRVLGRPRFLRDAEDAWRLDLAGARLVHRPKLLADALRVAQGLQLLQRSAANASNGTLTQLGPDHSHEPVAAEEPVASPLLLGLRRRFGEELEGGHWPALQLGPDLDVFLAALALRVAQLPHHVPIERDLRAKHSARWWPEVDRPVPHAARPAATHRHHCVEAGAALLHHRLLHLHRNPDLGVHARRRLEPQRALASHVLHDGCAHWLLPLEQAPDAGVLRVLLRSRLVFLRRGGAHAVRRADSVPLSRERHSCRRHVLLVHHHHGGPEICARQRSPAHRGSRQRAAQRRQRRGGGRGIASRITSAHCSL